jgi:hypothetical protein
MEPRQLFNALFVGPGQSIQAAINLAHPGDTIRIKAGIYVGQLVIPASKCGLTLTTYDCGQVVVKAPPTVSGTGAILEDAGAKNVDIEGLTITGPSAGIKYGILIDGNGSASLCGLHVTNTQDVVLTLDASAGIGIGVTSGYAWINNTTVDNYERAGIRIGPMEDSAANPIFTPGSCGAWADISHTWVNGIGPSSVVLQNGIEFTFGAGGSVDRSVVGNNIYTPQTIAGTGIFALDAGLVSISNSTVYNCDENVVIDAGNNQYGGSFGARVCNVESFGATFDGVDLVDGARAAILTGIDSHDNGWDGIYVDSVSTCNIIRDSKFCNNGLYDAEDDTYNSGLPVKNFSAGTLNTWYDNAIGTSNDPNLLKKAGGHGHRQDCDWHRGWFCG